MVESIIALLGAGLKLWTDKNKTKYVDHLMQLKKDYYAEYNKPEAERSDAVLDDILYQLRVLGDSFAAAVAAQNT